MNEIQIYPSFFAAPAGTEDQIIAQLESKVYGFHCDILNDSWKQGWYGSQKLYEKLRSLTKKTFQFHAMTKDPYTIAKQLRNLEPAEFYFHIEAVTNIMKIITSIRNCFDFVGIAVSPATPIEMLYNIIPAVDGILLMGVEPGKSNQPYLPETSIKVDALSKFLNQNNISKKVCVDGGIGAKEIGELVQKGCYAFAVGSALVRAKNVEQKLEQLLQAAQFT